MQDTAPVFSIELIDTKANQKINEVEVQYQWYKFSTLLEGENKNFLEVAASELDNSNDQATYYCAITYDSASM